MVVESFVKEVCPEEANTAARKPVVLDHQTLLIGWLTTPQTADVPRQAHISYIMFSDPRILVAFAHIFSISL